MVPGKTNGGRLAALVRRLLPDRNPLRRTADRVEAVLLALLAAAFLVGAPLAALAGGGWAGAATRGLQQAEAAWRPVRATLLQGTHPAANAMYQGSLRQLVRASWAAPDGTPRAGRIYAPAGLRAGQPVTIWTDRTGHLAGYPVQHVDVLMRSALAGLLAVTALAVGLGVLWLAARRLLDRRRLAAWDVSWAVTGPQWTGKR